MILGAVSGTDCLVFILFLAPQLVIQAGFLRTVFYSLRALPFLFVILPLQLIRQHGWRRRKPSKLQSTLGPTVFEDLVIRCVRYAFRDIPVDVGRVFFSRKIILPFLRWRLFRHGYLKNPVYWRDYVHGKGEERLEGIWIKHQPEQPPDIVMYYIHGGGFALGSAHFYLEFLLVWQSMLVTAGYKNPAIFSLEYTLVPGAVYPTQVREALRGYRHILEIAGDASRVCVAGDSAGGNLVLSLLQVLGAQGTSGAGRKCAGECAALLPQPPLPRPRMAVLISPWVTLKTNIHYPSSADYLNRHTLWSYAREYAGDSMMQTYPASPGCCVDEALWRTSSPDRGYFVIYGGEEVFYPDIEAFLRVQESLGVEIRGEKIVDAIHAWPVAALYLSSSTSSRLDGLRCIVNEMGKRMGGDVQISNGKKAVSD